VGVGQEVSRVLQANGIIVAASTDPLETALAFYDLLKLDVISTLNLSTVKPLSDDKPQCTFQANLPSPFLRRSSLLDNSVLRRHRPPSIKIEARG